MGSHQNPTSGNILWLWDLNYGQTQVTPSQVKWQAYAWIHFKICQSSGTCYRLSPTAQGSFILASTFIEGIMSSHIRNKLRSCKAESLKGVFSQAILEDQQQKLRALDFETSRADNIPHCEVNAMRILSCYRCGSTSHLVRDCPMLAEPAQAPANNRVNQHGNDNNTSNNGSNNGDIQDALTAITQALQALTNRIDKMHTPTQKSHHTNNYNKSHGYNKPHNHNR